MSRKLHFEHNKQKSSTADTIKNDATTKSKRKQILEHHKTQKDAISFDTAQTNATSNATTGVAFVVSDDIPIASQNLGDGRNIAELQHGSSDLHQTPLATEIPDKNIPPSTSKFSLDVEGAALSETTDNAKQKRSSKLKAEESRLNFEQSVNHAGNDGDNSTQKQPDIKAEPHNANGEKSSSNHQNKSTSNQSTNDTGENVASDDTKADTSNNKLQFTKDEKKIAKLEKKADGYAEKLEKAQDKLPTKKVKKKELVFDDKKGKAVTKLTHEEVKIPIGEAKWNKPKKKSIPSKVVGSATSMTVSKIHAKVHQVEHENVGVKVAHQTELLTESAYRGAKSTAKTAYRFHKNRPYRQIAKLEQKSIKNKMKLDYRKALRDNPKLKSSPVSRFFQKRAIKRNYAKDLRNAKKAATTGGKAVGITAKAAKVVTAIVRKNPVFLIKAGLLLLIVFLLLSLLTMCVGMFSGGTAFVGAVSYAADYEDIDDASILYTKLETDLRIYINDIETNYPNYDEYRLSIDSIGHDPFALMAFLTAVYQDFTFAEVEATIRAIFEAQYTLELVSEVEIRTRTEERTGTGSWTDEDGNTHTYTYTYTVVVEYEWHILNATLTSRSFTEILMEMMDDDQAQHFYVLMHSKGARQFVGNPFDFDWRPFVTSLYGYRIHPISGGRQFHWGLDLGLPQGTPLLAGLDGTVVSVGYQPNGYGNFVVIECADGKQVRYAHCHEVFVTQGQAVIRGELIATVGTTGASTGPHLHIEVARNGRRLNPIFFLEFR